jgi:hypothetical protein
MEGIDKRVQISSDHLEDGVTGKGAGHIGRREIAHAGFRAVFDRQVAEYAADFVIEHTKFVVLVRPSIINGVCNAINGKTDTGM